MKRLMNLLLGALAGIVIASCGGGGSGTVAEGGIGGTGISSGSISAFSSIVVNGTKFDVDAAGITVNSDPNATQDDLEIGYVVRVDGDLDDGVAESVRFEADLVGEVDASAIPAGEAVGTLTVMQQTVVITATTVLAGVDAPDTITPADRVLVSGFRDRDDRLVATHLELNPAQATDQIVGQVDSSSSSSFVINTLVIDSAAEPDEGDFVLVRGDYDTTTHVFTPSFQIEELEFSMSEGTEVELEGIVDSFASISDFTVGGIRVDATGVQPEDETGAPATIGENSEVEVEGTFDANGILIADRVEVELEDNVELVARVANDPGAGGPVQFFNATGTPELTVAINGKTQLRDKTGNPVADFSVADLAMGDWVELDAFEDGNGSVTALKIERFDPDPDSQEASVEGLVDAAPSGSILTILGIDFDTTGADFDDGIQLADIGKDDIVDVDWTDPDPNGADVTVMLPIPVSDVELEEDN